ncbi:MAG: ROK family protein [Ruaniaceae bacterium]|nr:ROK family protein [Ruaniaceae bacterium]
MDYLAQLGAGPTSLAVDVGGTFIKWAVLDGEGNLHQASRYPTPRGDNPAESVANAVAEIAEIARRENPEIAVIGMTIPGTVDPVAGIGIYSENLGWRNAPIRQMVEDRTGALVTLIHDVRAAGNAEVHLGAAAGYREVAVVPIGTGISAALNSGGAPVDARGYAGEIGHLRVTAEPIACQCGGVGCLEAFASAAGIVRRYAALTGTEPVRGADVVTERARAGDPIAQRVWDEALDGLAFACAALCATTAPEVIVFAGGLSEEGGDFLDQIRERLAPQVTVVPMPALVTSTFRSAAGLVGAALAARSAWSAHN